MIVVQNEPFGKVTYHMHAAEESNVPQSELHQERFLNQSCVNWRLPTGRNGPIPRRLLNCKARHGDFCIRHHPWI